MLHYFWHVLMECCNLNVYQTCICGFFERSQSFSVLMLSFLVCGDLLFITRLCLIKGLFVFLNAMETHFKATTFKKKFT